MNTHREFLFPESDKSLWNFHFAIMKRRRIALSSQLHCFTFDLGKLCCQKLQRMTWQHFASCIWGVEKGNEERRGVHENKNADLARKALANRLLHCKACFTVVQRFFSVYWVVVREEVSAMLGFSAHSPHNSRHSCHLVWDILNPNGTADKKSYVAPWACVLYCLH